METTLPNAANTSDRELVITRLLKAPRELIFKVFTDPTHVAQWWGPQGFTNTVYEMDVRPGGVWRYMMHGPDGVDYPNKIVYLEVDEPKRLVYSHGTGIENDGFQPFHVTITFEDQNGQTYLTMRMLCASVEVCNEMKKFGAVEGGNSTMDCLEEYLATL